MEVSAITWKKSFCEMQISVRMIVIQQKSIESRNEK